MPENIYLDILILKIDKGAIFKDGVPELMASALKFILFDSEYRKTYT